MGDVIYGLFAPHGPDLLGVGKEPFASFQEEEKRTIVALKETGRRLLENRPDVILLISPHWNSTRGFQVNISEAPEMIYDYYGFPKEFYEVNRKSVGDPQLALHLVEEGRRLGNQAEATLEHGLDHGHWIPLYVMSEKWDIPVVPLSIASLTLEEHDLWGKTIASAITKSDRRVAVIAAGSILHRLDLMDPHAPNQPWPAGEQFLELATSTIVKHGAHLLRKIDKRLWQEVAPEGDLKPLFILNGILNGLNFRRSLLANERVFTYLSNTVIEFIHVKGAHRLSKKNSASNSG